jgi:hypothetical protein
MPRFELKLNDTADWAEHDWLVFEDGVMVAGFAGSNAAERFIARREAEARIAREEAQRRMDAALDRQTIASAIAIEKEIARARRTSHVSNAEARRIHALLGRR